VRKWLLRTLGVAVVLLLVWLLVSSFLPRPVVVEAGRVTRGDLTVSLEGEGKTRLKERYTLEAPIAGTLARVEVHPGDAVTAGALIASLSPSTSALLDPQSRAVAEARLRSAQAARRQARATVDRAATVLRQAQLHLERTRQLSQLGAAERVMLEQAETEAQARQSEVRAAQFAEQVAGHEVEFAQAALRRGAGGADAEALGLTSPVDGRVLRVPREDEGPVAAGAPIVEVGDPRNLEVVADVLTRDAVSLRPGLEAVIGRWGGDRPLRGRVRVVEPSAFTKVSPLGVEEQRVNVVIGLDPDRPADDGLGEAYAVDVTFVLSRRTGVLRVPASAIFRHEEGWAAFVVRGGKARLQRVTLGPNDSITFELRGGLTEGETVILHPGELVREGVRVAVRG
jgi:HlyD family secretion protein